MIVGPLFLVAAVIITFHVEPNLQLFIALVLAQVATFLAITWVFGLTRQERQWFRELARRRFRSTVGHVGNLGLGAQKPLLNEKE